MSVRRPKPAIKAKRVPIVRDLTRQELADELDLHADSIKRHHTRPDPPPYTRAGQACYYNAAEYQAWMKENGLTGGQGWQANDSPDIEVAKLRKENALADKHELDNALKRAELIRVDEVKAWIGQRVTAVKNRFIGLGAAITPHLEGRDASERQTIIDDRITEILNELARP